MICVHKMSIKKKIKSFTTDSKNFSINDDDIYDVMFLKFLYLLQRILNLSFLLLNFFDQIFDINSNESTHSFALYRELKTI